MKFVIFTSHLILLLSSHLYPAGTTSANFLKIAIGARQASMGEAFVGIANDANGINWNIAGLSQLKMREFSAMHLEYLEEIRYETFSYVHPFENSAIGISLGYLHLHGIPRTIIDEQGYLIYGWGYRETGKFGAEDRTIIAGYSRRLNDKISAGAGIRYLSETLDDITAWSVAVDFGGLYKFSNRITFGASIQNVGTELKFIKRRERLPINFRLGAGYKSTNAKLNAGLDLVKSIDSELEICTGAEYWIIELLALRAGYRMRGFEQNYKLGLLSGLTAGIGFKLFNYALDYGFIPYGDLGYTHRISLSGKF